MDRLPDYMKICFLAVYNFANEMAFDPLKEQEFHIIRYLKKVTFSQEHDGFNSSNSWSHYNYFSD